LEQDYQGPKELVILNDFTEQELVFNHAEVRVINYSERIKPLGRKFNINVQFCRYDILAPWEDDDFFLRHRLSFALAHMKNGVFHTHDAFVESAKRQLHLSRNYFHSQHMFTRELFEKVGGYNELDKCSIDVSLMGRLRDAVGIYTTTLTNPDDISYVYVWSAGGSYHGSGMGIDNASISDSAAEVVKRHVREGLVETGRVLLEPKLRYNIYDFLPTSQGIFKRGSARVYYGAEERDHVEITAKVIDQCITQGNSEGTWSMPANDADRARLFGDPLPNVVKTVVVRAENVSRDDLVEAHVPTTETRLFNYSGGILTLLPLASEWTGGPVPLSVT